MARVLNMLSVLRGGCLLAGLLTLLPVSLQAAPAQTLLTSVNAQRLQSYQMQMQFHLLSLEGAEPRVASQMQETVALFAQQTEQLDELSAGLALDAEVLALQVQARDFQQKVLANEALTQGWVSVNTTNAMSASGATLNQAYAHTLNKLSAQGSASDPLVEQAILMQRIAAEYVRGSTSVDGNSVIYDDALDLELPVDKLAVQFSQQLTLLEQQHAGTPALSQRLQKVATMWNYIEKSLLNYREKTVPSLVVRYNDKIVASLVTPTVIAAQP